MLECQSLSAQQEALKTPSSPTLSDDPTLLSQLSIASDAFTVVAPHLISEFEKVHYWHGISIDPPELLYRSDLESNPFSLPLPGTRWSQLPVKTTEGVFETPLNAVWHIVAPIIVALFKKRGIKHSALKTARFSTRNEDRKKTLRGEVVRSGLYARRRRNQPNPLRPSRIHSRAGNAYCYEGEGGIGCPGYCLLLLPREQGQERRA